MIGLDLTLQQKRYLEASCPAADPSRDDLPAAPTVFGRLTGLARAVINRCLSLWRGKPATKVQLLVSRECPSCDKAKKIWSAVCGEREADFAALDVHRPEGKALLIRWRLQSIPALIIDGELMAVGVQNPDQARELIDIAETR